MYEVLIQEWSLKRDDKIVARFNGKAWILNSNEVTFNKRRTGFINEELLDNLQYNSIWIFNKEGVTKMKIWNKFWLIKKTWEIILPPQFDNISSRKDCNLFIWTLTNKEDIIDNNWNHITKNIYKRYLIDSKWNYISSEPFKDIKLWSTNMYNIAACASKNEWGYKLLDIYGNYISNKWYDYIDETYHRRPRPSEDKTYWDYYTQKNIIHDKHVNHRNTEFISMISNKWYGMLTVKWMEIIPASKENCNRWEFPRIYIDDIQHGLKLVKYKWKKWLMKNDWTVLAPVGKVNNIYENNIIFFETIHDNKKWLFDSNWYLKINGYETIEKINDWEFWKVKQWNWHIDLYDNNFNKVISTKEAKDIILQHFF